MRDIYDNNIIVTMLCRYLCLFDYSYICLAKYQMFNVFSNNPAGRLFIFGQPTLFGQI